MNKDIIVTDNYIKFYEVENKINKPTDFHKFIFLGELYKYLSKERFKELFNIYHKDFFPLLKQHRYFNVKTYE